MTATLHRETEHRRRVAVDELIAAYEGDTYRLLTALADHLGATLAYVDRRTVEAHLEHAVPDADWVAIRDQFGAMDLDTHVGDHGSFRTDWIETVLAKAGVPGYRYIREWAGTSPRFEPEA